jgi:hypothetical protein
VEDLEAVESTVHTTAEQYLMSITAIARQAQGIRAGEVIAKLAEDAYFMRVDNRVNQPPPARNRDNKAKSRSADLGRNRTRAGLPAQPNRTRANVGGPSQGGNSNREVAPHRAPAGSGNRDPDGGGSDDGRSNHGANRRAGGGGNRGGHDHANSHASGASQGGYDTRQKIEELRRKKSATAGDNDDFPAFSPRLRHLLLPEKFKPLGITKYDAKQDPIQWLRCYALSIENAGGNNDTKCLYFPFCLDQAPEGPIRQTREGGSEWEPKKNLLEGDGNSYKMNTASNTRLRLTTQVGQAHVATGVPLDLGTNTHTLPTRERSGTPNLESSDPHRSDR